MGVWLFLARDGRSGGKIGVGTSFWSGPGNWVVWTASGCCSMRFRKNDSSLISCKLARRTLKITLKKFLFMNFWMVMNKRNWKFWYFNTRTWNDFPNFCCYGLVHAVFYAVLLQEILFRPNLALPLISVQWYRLKMFKIFKHDCQQVFRIKNLQGGRLLHRHVGAL